jgi:hypothetical protein
MRKLLLLPVLALLFASCSTDDLSSDLQQSQSVSNEETARAGSFPGTLPGYDFPVNQGSCFNSAAGQVSINLPSGLGGMADITFRAITSGAGDAYYNVRLEIETLVDCEDLNLGTGAPNILYLGNLNNLDQNAPAITLKPYDLPADCYRWRFVIDRKISGRFQCTSYTPWYDEPLY